MKVKRLISLIATTLLLGCANSSIFASVCWDESYTLYFESSTGDNTGRMSINDIKPSALIEIDNNSFSFNSSSSLGRGQYCIVKNPSDVSSNYADITAANGNFLMVLPSSYPTNDSYQPNIILRNLIRGTKYVVSFDVTNLTAKEGSNCKPNWGSHFGFGLSVRNSINPLDKENTRFTVENKTPFDSNKPDDLYWQLDNADTRTIKLEITPDSYRSDAIIMFSEDPGKQGFSDCTAIGISNIKVELSACLSIIPSHTDICGGKTITLSLNKYEGKNEIKWYRKYKNEKNYTLIKETEATNLVIEDAPSDTAYYYVEVGDETSEITTINVGQKCLYIIPHYPSNVCVEDSNTLIAFGYAVVDNLDSKDFIWEEYDNATSSWKTLPYKTMKIRVKPKETTRYRVTLNGESGEFEQEVRHCSSALCNGLNSEIVFLETFGFFIDSVTYVDSKDVIHHKTVETSAGKDFNVERYWAPDPYGYVVSPNNREQAYNSYDHTYVSYKGQPVMVGTDGHEFAMEDPRNDGVGYSWCNNEDRPEGNYRIEDGFYSLVRNPSEADCGNQDFWDGKDHTGNPNGAMMMVNCGPTKAPIYRQTVDVGCPNLHLSFSAYLSNAITYLDKDGRTRDNRTPVNLRLDIMDMQDNVLNSIETGDIIDDKFVWTKAEMNFISGDDTKFNVQLSNNGDQGSGNDILLDDIAFSICLPKVLLTTDYRDTLNNDVIKICNDTTVSLIAIVINPIIDNPLFKFQYKDKNGEWQDIDPDQTDFTSDRINISTSDKRLRGDVEYRVIMASDMGIIEKVTKNLPLSSCDIYAMGNSSLNIINNYGGPMDPDQVIEVCKGETIEMTGGRAESSDENWNHDWAWEWRDAQGNVIEGYEISKDTAKMSIKHNVQDTATTLYFYGYDDVCIQKQKFQFVGKKVANMDIDATSRVACDSLILFTNSPDPNVTLRWRVYNENEILLLGDTVVIKPETLPSSGIVVVDVDTTSAVFCPVNMVEIPFRINAGNSLNVSLDAGGIDRLCLDPEGVDSFTLQAKVTPEASAEDIQYYLWSVNGVNIDTTTVSTLTISTDPANKHHELLKPGAKLNFAVSVADGVCFTLDNPSDPGHFYMEVSEKYTLALTAEPNDSICLTDLKSDTIIVLNVSATSLSGSTDVINNIKTFVWYVDDEKFATTSEPKFIFLMSDHPAALDKYIQAGTAPKFSVSAIDSICYSNENDAPKTDLQVVFNEAYSMIISPDGKTVCVPEGDDIDPNLVLLTLTVSTDPANAYKHVKEYMWYMDGVQFASTGTNKLELTYSMLNDRIGTKPVITVKSYDGICSDKNNPAENSNQVSVDVRNGGYSLKIQLDTDRLCIDTINPENNKINLSAIVTPSIEEKNIEKYYWLENGVTIDSSESKSFVITQTDHPEIFTAGKTAIFNVMTYDSICANGYVYGVGDGEPFLINVSYEMDIEADDLELCYENDSEASLTLRAVTIPEAAINHVNRFRWYKNGVQFAETSSNEIIITNKKYKNILIAGEKPLFEVDSYDDICYTDNSSPKGGKEFTINFKYRAKIDSDGKTEFCLSSDSLVLRASISPATAANQIKTYIWQFVENGITTTFDTTYAPKDSVIISQANYPNIFHAGMSASFILKTTDGICYTDDNPNVSDSLNININESYSMTIESDMGDTICFDDATVLRLTAKVDPSGATRFIKWYRWYDGKNLIDSTTTPYIDITKAKYPKVLVAGARPKFSVDSYDGMCYTSQDPATSDSLEIFLNEKYNFILESDNGALCLETDTLTLTAKTNPAEAAQNIKYYNWYVNGELFETTTPPNNYLKISYSTHKDLLDRLSGSKAQFSIQSVDGICYTDDNPAVSNDMSIEIGGHYTIELDAPSDSVCLESDEAARLVLRAKVDPTKSKNLIKWYRWYRNGTLLDSTQTDSIVITNTKYPGAIAAGSNPTFAVDAYDYVCYDPSNAPKSADTRIVISVLFDISLSAGDKTTFCYGSDTLRITADVYPSGAKNNIHKYYWTMDGVPFDTTDVNYIVLSRENYPNLVDSIKHPVFGIQAIDNICYDDNNPKNGKGLNIEMNSLFNLGISSDKDAVCNTGFNTEFQLTAWTNPIHSATLLKKLDWYQIDDLTGDTTYLGQTDRPVKPMSIDKPGDYTFIVKGYDGVCFSSKPAVSDGKKISVHENIVVSLHADRNTYCVALNNVKPEDNQVNLTAVVERGTPSSYYLYQGEDELYAITLPAKSATFSVVPIKGANTFKVKVVDDVCNFKDTASAETDPLGIKIFDPIKIDVSADKNIICLGETITLTSKVKEGAPAYLKWYGLTRDGQIREMKLPKPDTVITDTPLEPGYVNYMVIASDEVCDNAIVSIEGIRVKENIEVKLLADREAVVIGGDVNFLADVTAGEPVAYNWKIDGKVVATTYGADWNEYPKSSSKYTVEVTDSLCSTVESSVDINVKLPTAFTPFSVDGFNDMFMLGFKVVIFNRYGQEIFSGENGWDGYTHGMPADPGVYFYSVTMKDGKIEKGTIEIVKLN